MADDDVRRGFYSERARQAQEWIGRAAEAATCLGRIEQMLGTLLQGQGDLMAQIDDLSAAVAALGVAATAAADRVTAADAALATQIASLQAQVAAGTPVDLTAVLAGLVAIQATLGGIAPPPPAP